MGKMRYSKDDIEILKNKNMSLEEQSKKLKRNRNSIILKKMRIGLLSKKRKWTDEDIEVLKDTNLTIQQCADKLDRTYAAVALKSVSIGIHRKRWKK